MNVLIAVKGCERDAERGHHQAIRETWGRDRYSDLRFWSDLRFFVGDGSRTLLEDEVRVNCKDDYMALPQKTRGILHWTLMRDYDFVFLCDVDSFVIVDRLMSSGFEQYDIVGFFNGRIGLPNETEGKYWAWISGGNGYWLSRKAAELIMLSPSTDDWAEDRITGQVLGPYIQRGEIKAFHDARYGHVSRDPWETQITSHYCSRGAKREFDPEWMRKRWEYNRAKV